MLLRLKGLSNSKRSWLRPLPLPNDLASAVNAAYGRYFIAQREAQLARDLERGERARFSPGDSALFLVNQRERAAAEAQIKLLDLRAADEQALAAFRVAVMQY